MIVIHHLRWLHRPLLQSQRKSLIINILQSLFQQLRGRNGEDNVWEAKEIFHTRYVEQLDIDFITSTWIHWAIEWICENSTSYNNGRSHRDGHIPISYMLFSFLHLIYLRLLAMNETTLSLLGLSIDIKYNIINIFLTSKLSRKVIRSFILDLMLITQRRRLPSPTHSWLYLNYNDARCRWMAWYYASKTNIITPTSKVCIASHSNLC